MTQYKYITTPIYYASGTYHEGHIYASVLMDLLGKHYRSRGFAVKTLTGTDEHGEKIEEKAKKQNLSPQELVDTMSATFKRGIDSFEVDYDVFMRTTKPEHHKNVQSILQQCYDRGDIYYGEHQGHYCVDCEEFLTEKEMDEGKQCLVHKRQTEVRKEGNYFFKTTKYKKQLIELVKKGKIVSQPRYQKELLSLLEDLNTDLSISRPKSRTEWGIELPFDAKHVSYVWFDALPNYTTGLGGYKECQDSGYWKNVIHVVGKDIMRFHAIYWPAMCLSIGIEVPQLLVTGWLLNGGHKSSKSLGNALTPEHLKILGKDVFVNTCYRLMTLGDDFDISVELFLERYNADLANGIGNLFSRTLNMIEKYCDKKIPSFHKDILNEEEHSLSQKAEALPSTVASAIDDYRLQDAFSSIWSLIAETDKYITTQKPWALAKDLENNRRKLDNVLAHCTAVIRQVGLLSWPFFNSKMKLLLDAVGEDTQDMATFFQRSQSFYNINSGHTLSGIPMLFARFDIPKTLEKLGIAETSPEKNQEKTKKPKKESKREEGIDFKDFAKVHIKVGTVLKAETVAGSDKLLKLEVSLGDLGQKNIFSGIRQWVKPEQLVNKKVLVAANLKPRKMRFGVSEGMLLSTENDAGEVLPIFVDEKHSEGSQLL